MAGRLGERAKPAPPQIQDFRDPNWGAQRLSSINIFRGFNLEELKSMYARGEIISLKSKAYAIIEGEPTRGLYVILSGAMSVYKNDLASGVMHRIAYLQEGNSFGELSLFDHAPRSASVAAESTVHLFCLGAEAFTQFLDHQGDHLKLRFYRACTDDLVNRFRKLNGDYIIVQRLLWAHGLRHDKNPESDGAEKADEVAA